MTAITEPTDTVARVTDDDDAVGAVPELVVRDRAGRARLRAARPRLLLVAVGLVGLGSSLAMLAAGDALTQAAVVGGCGLALALQPLPTLLRRSRARRVDHVLRLDAERIEVLCDRRSADDPWATMPWSACVGVVLTRVAARRHDLVQFVPRDDDAVRIPSGAGARARSRLLDARPAQACMTHIDVYDGGRQAGRIADWTRQHHPEVPVTDLR